MPTAADLLDLDRRHYWHAFTQMAEYEPLVIARAEGCRAAATRNARRPTHDVCRAGRARELEANTLRTLALGPPFSMFSLQPAAQVGSRRAVAGRGAGH